MGMEKINVGIMGVGTIAVTMARTINAMANTINGMQGVNLYGIASRTGSKAKKFAEEYGALHAYDSYESMVQDENIQLVYIATPHSEHYAGMKLCLAHGKAVLCEKAFTANAAQAKEILQESKKKNILVAEAIWTRYMPFLTTMREVLGSGIIGEPYMLTANLGYVINHVERITNPALAGGALLDVGVYTLNFAAMMFGSEVEKISSVCTYTNTGVDEQNSMTLLYKGGKMAVLNSSTMSLSDRKGIIHGTKGFIVIENINNFASLRVFDENYTEVEVYHAPEQITGFEYEVEACVKALKAGAYECEQMPHAEIIRMMEWMDEMREQWGIKYPFEDKT